MIIENGASSSRALDNSHQAVTVHVSCKTGDIWRRIRLAALQAGCMLQDLIRSLVSDLHDMSSLKLCP